MPRYLTGHNMACMTRQGARQLAATMREADVEFLRLLGDMTGGQLVAEFNAPSRQALESWLAGASIHYEWLRRVDFEATREEFHDL